MISITYIMMLDLSQAHITLNPSVHVVSLLTLMDVMDMLYCRRVVNSHATSRHARVRGMWCLPHCCVSCMFCLHALYGHVVVPETRFHCSVVTRPSSATCRLVSRGHCSPLVGGPQATLITAVAKWGLGLIRDPAESNSSKKLVVRLRHICTAERGDM